MLIIITILINSAALYLIFHYFKWKLTSYNFLEGYESRKEEISREIDTILVEINRTTERNLQILEAKINQLNEAVARSEKVFNALNKEKNSIDNTGAIYQKLERKSINDRIEKMGRLQDEKQQSEAAASELPMTRDDLRDKVITMYKNGIDIDLISRNLGVTSGEVELIISISKIK